MANRYVIRIMWGIGFLLIILLMAMMFSGCGSRKKQKQSKVYIEQVATRDMKNLILRNNTESVEKVSEIKRIEANTEIGKFTGKIADPTLPATVEQETKEGKTIRTYTNFLTVNTEDEKKRESTIDSLQKENKFKDNSITELRTENDELRAKIDSLEQLQVDRKTGIPWWLCLILVLVLLIYGYISYLKNSINPMKWIG